MYTYKISTGQLRGLDDNYLGTGWAGQGKYKNDPAATNVPNLGPLPVGLYTIGAAYHHPKLGPLTMNLTPDSTNVMFGRSVFRLHGAAAVNPELSSEGCIIQMHDVRLAVASNLDREFRLQVIA